MNNIYTHGNTIVPRDDNGKPKWWKITLLAFTDYGSPHIPTSFQGEYFGTVEQVKDYAATLPSADSWGTLKLEYKYDQPEHCPGCTLKTCPGRKSRV